MARKAKKIASDVLSDKALRQMAMSYGLTLTKEMLGAIDRSSQDAAVKCIAKLAQAAVSAAEKKQGLSPEP